MTEQDPVARRLIQTVHDQMVKEWGDVGGELKDDVDYVPQLNLLRDLHRWLYGNASWSDTIRHERKRLEITIGQCAKMLGCTVLHYSALERGLEEPTQSEKSQLAWYFKRYAEVVSAGDPAKGKNR